MTIRLTPEEHMQLDPAGTHSFASPIPCQVISNGEFLPAPQGFLQKSFEAKLKLRAGSLQKNTACRAAHSCAWHPDSHAHF
jgi:hypothetical protein